jgi:hypothetical protein
MKLWLNDWWHNPNLCVFGCRPTQNATAVPTPVTNPFGTLPAMPQMMIGRSSGSGPSVQYGIASMPVSLTRTEITFLLFKRGVWVKVTTDVYSCSDETCRMVVLVKF